MAVMHLALQGLFADIDACRATCAVREVGSEAIRNSCRWAWAVPVRDAVAFWLKTWDVEIGVGLIDGQQEMFVVK